MRASATSTEGTVATTAPLPALVAAVQRNCDLADAHHAREKSLCTYLLEMREYFRWFAALPPGAPPDRAAVGDWISRREQHWEELRDCGEDFVALPLGDGVDPFDQDTANRRLAASGLVYGAGIAAFGAPVFFLAARESRQVRGGAIVIVAGREFARGASAPPAASRGNSVLVRTDALRRWLWTRAELAQRDAGSAFAVALAAHAGGATAGEAVEAMARGEVESLVLHELGELRAGQMLGAEWERMLVALEDRAAELTVRAVRDLLADSLVTLPALLERRSLASLHTWFALLDGPRRRLAPALAALHAERFDRERLDRIADETARQAARARTTAHDLLAYWRRGGAAAVRAATRALLR